MLCTIFVHVQDRNRFLVVRREAGFPASRYAKQNWRLLATGAEPPTKMAEAGLMRDGYYEYRATPIDD